MLRVKNEINVPIALSAFKDKMFNSLWTLSLLDT